MGVPNPTGKGGFVAGQVANPGGRPRAAREATVEARRFAVEAIHALVKTMRAETGAVRVSAAREILDRALGRAPQSVDLTLAKSIGQMSLEELQHLEEQLTGHALMAAIAPPAGDLLSSVENDVLGEPVTLDLDQIEVGH